jgi:hypothetical protein
MKNNIRLSDRMLALEGIIASLQLEIQEIRGQQSRAEIRALVEEVYNEDRGELQDLRRDAAKFLNLLVERGMISREDLNEALK